MSICIAAYNAERFLEETLESVFAQRWPEIEVVISVDKSTDRTSEIAHRWGAAGRVRVIEQTKRLGWVGNTNAALKLASHRYAMIMPHDDLIDADYVGACMDALSGAPGAALAFSDLTIIGEPNSLVIEEPETGTASQRVSGVLSQHFAAVGLRGVFDRSVARRYFVPEYALADFAADTLFVAQMAAQAPIIRVPKPLYHKRLMAKSAHWYWKTANGEEADLMWVVHCIEMAIAVSRVRKNAFLDPDIRRAFRARLQRRHVKFLNENWPEVLREDAALLPQLLKIYLKVWRRRPHYSWAN